MGFNVSPLLETAEVRCGGLRRLITSAFLHAGPMHLLPNLFGLWELGRPIERVYGHAKTALLVAFLAAGSAAFECAFFRGGVGLSGALYGLAGLLSMRRRGGVRFSNATTGSDLVMLIAGFVLCVAATAANCGGRQFSRLCADDLRRTTRLARCRRWRAVSCCYVGSDDRAANGQSLRHRREGGGMLGLRRAGCASRRGGQALVARCRRGRGR